MALASCAVSLVLRLRERRSRPSSFSERGFSIITTSAIRNFHRRSTAVSVQIPPFFKIVCFLWYLSRYQSIWAVPCQGWSVTPPPDAVGGAKTLSPETSLREHHHVAPNTSRIGS